MKSHPLVTIVTPTYNHEKFIGKCIESVLAQTYPYWEQIIIDDGSTDGTGDIVAQYTANRIKYVRQDNIGIWRLDEIYNKALRLSKGELIAVLEGDDLWPSYKLEKQVSAFETPGVVLSWGKATVVNRTGKTLYTNPLSLRWFEHRSKEEVLQRLLFQNFITACTAMCRKDALFAIGGFKQPQQVPYVDYPTWLELSLVGELKPVDEVLGFWRRHGDQISTTMKMEMANARNHCAISFYQRLPHSARTRLGLSLEELQNLHTHNVAAIYFNAGRINLLERRWIKARKNFGKALHEGTPSIKAMAFAGIVCSYLRLDMEWAALRIRKPCLSELY